MIQAHQFCMCPRKHHLVDSSNHSSRDKYSRSCQRRTLGIPHTRCHCRSRPPSPGRAFHSGCRRMSQAGSNRMTLFDTRSDCHRTQEHVCSQYWCCMHFPPHLKGLIIMVNWLWENGIIVSDTCNGCGSVHIHPPTPTTHDAFVPWACHVTLRLLSGQELLGRLLIPTKALCSVLDSSIWVALALAVFLTSENEVNACPDVLKNFWLMFSYIFTSVASWIVPSF